MTAIRPEYIPTKILSLILSMREDLRALGFHLAHKRAEFFQWLVNHGVHEYPVLLELEGVRDHTDWLADNHWAQPPHPFGVNLVGYAFGELGIGEDVRMAGRALMAAKVPFTLLNFKPGDDIPQNDHSMAQFVSDDSPYAVNIFCMTAQENGRHFLTQGKGRYGGRYNIGYWPWELAGWPRDWELSFDLVDEVWVSTWHTYSALADICPKPLFRMPMAVEIPDITWFKTRSHARAHFGLPDQATLFCFSFDFNSSMYRKNPQACVAAFMQAFPVDVFNSDDVGLVIKAHAPSKPNPAWQQLKRLATQDSRIHIIEGTLSKPDLLALYQACDCFVSLHRAEGFGRGIAEALKLGLHVIATGYSGNVDFCEAPGADLVDYQLIPVKSDQYPYAQGQVWADPDVNHAARLMLEFVQSGAPRQMQSWSAFDANVVGQTYKKRLQQIKSENPELFS
ncbi:glycosyltransferase [Orrella daihaiensis]|uniref:Glycosyltransferase n=1 Tax=Orrella daihaiensis TaxID=2782176 RepID=A0ABY4AM76_9BURK|nr:glycosyltransferase [Orrella daihaiensis]UOD51421.1 glycosyltransferase [Orrella daihaiensis]